MTTEKNLTELQMEQYPGFVNILAGIVFNKLTDQSKQNATAIVGVTDLGLTLSQFVNDILNDERRKQEKKFGCRLFFVDCNMGGAFSQFFRGKIIPNKKIAPLKPSDQVLFVHCLFEDPLQHPGKAPWKYTTKAMRHYEISQLLRDPKQVKKIIGRLGGTLIQSVVLPIPYEEYARFLTPQ